MSGLVNCCVIMHSLLLSPFLLRRTFDCCVSTTVKAAKPRIVSRRPSESAKSRICYSKRRRNSGHRRGAAVTKAVGQALLRAACVDGDCGDGGGEGESGRGGRGAEIRRPNTFN